ncbi:hypothetical protein QUB49_27780 [Microcoleus sp. AT9_B4]
MSSNSQDIAALGLQQFLNSHNSTPADFPESSPLTWHSRQIASPTSPSNAASSRPNPPPSRPPPPPSHTSEELKYKTYRFAFLLPFDSAPVLQLVWKVHLQQICNALTQPA